MAGIANIAVEMGYDVLGFDKYFAPPMADMLQHNKITLATGYPESLSLSNQDIVIIGNSMTRSTPLIQDLISKRVKLYSGPEWLIEFVLRDRYVIAVTGSHGKTTITSMIAWVLSQAGLDPGYLIGGVVPQLALGGMQQSCATARLGTSRYFVIEADEYDSAFFDKRPKFIHYWPTLLIISHIDFDHADIYHSLGDIVQQYKYLLRLLPADGKVITTGVPAAIVDQVKAFGLSYSPYGESDDSMQYIERLGLKIPGVFNRLNALAAVMACKHLGVEVDQSCQFLSRFSGASRRQTLMYHGAIKAYDDFAHHPKEVQAVCEGFVGCQRLVVCYHPASFTQRTGGMDKEAIEALSLAHKSCVLLPPKHRLDISLYEKAGIKCIDTEHLLAEYALSITNEQDIFVLMSANYLDIFWRMFRMGLQSSFGDQDCVLDDEALL